MGADIMQELADKLRQARQRLPGRDHLERCFCDDCKLHRETSDLLARYDATPKIVTTGSIGSSASYDPGILRAAGVFPTDPKGKRGTIIFLEETCAPTTTP